MSYATTANRPNPVAALGALGIPAGFGALLIFGLAFTVIPPTIIDNPDTYDVEVVDLDPIVDPEIEPKADTESTTPVPDQVPQYQPAPRPDSDYTFDNAISGTISDLPGLGDGIGEVGPVVIDVPPPAPMFDPIAAEPRGNPGGWITNDDYSPNWIRRGFEGVAGFTLRIDANGKVSNCSITRSTGHSQLDAATCRLLTNRAEFTPARDSSGAIVAGTYSSSVNWQIP